MIRKVCSCLLAALLLGSVDSTAAIPETFEVGSPTVLITGSNRGIGLGFVEHYAAQGWNVVATCRNPGMTRIIADLTLDDPGTITNTDGKTIPW